MIHRSTAGSFWVIVAVSFFLRFAELGQSGYWFDEILTLQNSPLPWPQMLVALEQSESNKPPLYYVFMHQWLKGGDSEIWARLPSAFFGALTCGLFYLLGYRLLGNWAGWALAVYLTLSPFHIGYSQEARMYTLFGLEGAAALLCLVVYFQEKKTAYLIGFGLFSVLTNYTFSYGFFLLGLAGLLLLAQWKNLGPRRALIAFATVILSFALFVPWLLRMIHVSSTPEGVQFYKGPPWPAIAYTFYSLGYGFDLGPSLTDLQVLGSSYFRLHPTQTVLVLVALAVLVIITIRGLWAFRHDLFLLVFCLGGLLIFLLGPAVISLLKPTVTYNPRYAFLVLIPFSLALAVGGRALWRDGLPGRTVVVLYGAFLALSLFHYYGDPAYRREDLRAASRFVEQQPQQPHAIVVCANNLKVVVAHYYHGPASLLDFNVNDPKTFDADTQKLAAQLNGLDRFAIVYARPDHGDRQRQFIPWLKAHYQLLQEKNWPGTEAYLFANRPPAGALPQ